MSVPVNNVGGKPLTLRMLGLYEEGAAFDPASPTYGPEAVRPLCLEYYPR